MKTSGFWKTHLPTPTPLNITKRSSKYSPGSTNTAIENPPCSWHLPGKMVIFPGYISLPEDIWTNLPWTNSRKVTDIRFDSTPLTETYPHQEGYHPLHVMTTVWGPSWQGSGGLGTSELVPCSQGNFGAEGKNRSHPCCFLLTEIS